MRTVQLFNEGPDMNPCGESDRCIVQKMWNRVLCIHRSIASMVSLSSR